jgi:hypothetical protein
MERLYCRSLASPYFIDVTFSGLWALGFALRREGKDEEDWVAM